MPAQPDVDESADRLRVPHGSDAARLLAGDPLDELVPGAPDAAPGHARQPGQPARVDTVRAAAHHEKRHVAGRENQAVGNFSRRAPKLRRGGGSRRHSRRELHNLAGDAFRGQGTDDVLHGRVHRRRLLSLHCLRVITLLLLAALANRFTPLPGSSWPGRQ